MNSSKNYFFKIDKSLPMFNVFKVEASYPQKEGMDDYYLLTLWGWSGSSSVHHDEGRAKNSGFFPRD
jgi:hypothetical protein